MGRLVSVAQYQYLDGSLGLLPLAPGLLDSDRKWSGCRGLGGRRQLNRR